MLKQNIFRQIFWIFLMILLFCTVSISRKAQNQKTNMDPEQKVPPSVYTNRDIWQLLDLVAHRHILEIEDGEYIKGDWSTVVNTKPPKLPKLGYPTGVTLYGMQCANELLKDKKIDEYVSNLNKIASRQYAYLRWQKQKFGTYTHARSFWHQMRMSMLDDCGAIGAQMLESVLRHNAEVTPEMSEFLEIMGNYVTNVQSRLPDGTFWRPESRDSPTIWADDLYMSCPFLVRWGEYKKEPKHLDDAVKQIINFASYLQDDDGIFLHAYFVEEKKRSCCKWGRANGWAIVAIVEVLSAVPEDHPVREQVLTIMRKFIEGLKKYQDESGLWHQVLDHPELSWGEETSCSAMFTYSITRAVNRGWIDKSNLEVVKRAYEGINKRITADGAILGAVMWCSIGKDLKYYEERKKEYDGSHAHGTVMLALTELILATQK